MSGEGALAGYVALTIGLLVFSLVVALVLGFVCRSIMRKKGRSGAGGFCLGFFLGLIGLVICLALSDVGRLVVAVPAGQYPAGYAVQLAPPQPIQQRPREPVVPMARWSCIAALVAVVVSVLAFVAGDGYYGENFLIVVIAAWIAAVACGVVFLATSAPAALHGCLGAVAGAGVIVAQPIGSRYGWGVLTLMAVLLAGGALALCVAGARSAPVTKGYPFAGLSAALAFVVLAAQPAIDAKATLGWVLASAIVILACLQRGRWGPLVPLAIGITSVAWYLEQRVRWRWWGVSALELIAGALLLLGSVYLLAAATGLRSRPRPPAARTVPAAAFRAPTAAAPPMPFAAPTAHATPTAHAAPAGDDATVVRPRAGSGLALPPLPGAGGTGAAFAPPPTPAAAPTPAAVPPTAANQGYAPVPALFEPAGPAVAHPPAATGRDPASRRQPGDRPLASPWSMLLVLVGALTLIAPFVPFTSEPYSPDFVSALPFVVIGAAAVIAGIAAAFGYVSAYAAAAGLTASWGTLMVLVVWTIVDLIRWANDLDVSIDIGPGLVLFAASAVLGVIVIIPATVFALRAGSRRAHPILGLLVAGGMGLVVADVVRPHSGFAALDGPTESDVTVVAFVAVMVIAALLALFVRSGAAHAIAFGALLLPAATVLQGAVDERVDFDPLTAWGVLLAGVAAAIGVATASERTMRRGRGTVRLPAGGVAVAVAGLAVMLTPTAIGAIRQLTHDDGGGGGGSGESLSIGASRSGYLDPYSADTYRITGTGANVAFSVAGSGGLDANLEVLDASGFSVAFNDDYGGSYDPYVVVFLTAGVTYTVEVAGYQGSSGSYTIRAS